MPENHFGEEVAARYDASVAGNDELESVDSTVDFLAELAGNGPALEVGIGTGRVALPLRQRGVRVHGIDLSEAMVAKLRTKPGSEDIHVAIGDFTTARVDGAFSLAYLVFNTIMNLSQGEISHHYSVVDGKLEIWSIPFRYVWAAELDLMARIAGMKLRERWSGWKRQPFTGESTSHVSVWEKTAQ